MDTGFCHSARISHESGLQQQQEPSDENAARDVIFSAGLVMKRARAAADGCLHALSADIAAMLDAMPLPAQAAELREAADAAERYRRCSLHGMNVTAKSARLLPRWRQLPLYDALSRARELVYDGLHGAAGECNCAGDSESSDAWHWRDASLALREIHSTLTLASVHPTVDGGGGVRDLAKALFLVDVALMLAPAEKRENGPRARLQIAAGKLILRAQGVEPDACELCRAEGSLAWLAACDRAGLTSDAHDDKVGSSPPRIVLQRPAGMSLIPVADALISYMDRHLVAAREPAEWPPMLAPSPPVLVSPSLSAFRAAAFEPRTPTLLKACMESWPALRGGNAPACSPGGGSSGAGSVERCRTCGRAAAAAGGSAWARGASLLAAAGPRAVPVEVGSSYAAADAGLRMTTVSEYLLYCLAVTETAAAKENGDGRESEIEGFSQRRSGSVGDAVYLAQHELLTQVPVLAASVLTPDYCCLIDAAAYASGGDFGDGGGGGGVSAGEKKLATMLAASSAAPHGCTCAPASGPAPAPDVAVNAWLGPVGTRTPLHRDSPHNILAQVYGAKRVLLFAPAPAAAMCPVAAGALAANTSAADPLRPKEATAVGDEGLCAAPVYDARLRAGEALYIPPGWWHDVSALSSCASVSFWWPPPA